MSGRMPRTWGHAAPYRGTLYAYSSTTSAIPRGVRVKARDKRKAQQLRLAIAKARKKWTRKMWQAEVDSQATTHDYAMWLRNKVEDAQRDRAAAIRRHYRELSQ